MTNDIKRTWRFSQLLLIYFIILAPLCTLGYGSDNDTYRVLDSGRLTWGLHIATTSRNPGYWVYEAIVYMITKSTGYIASNLASLTIGIMLIWRFLKIAEKLKIRHSGMLSACLVATPVFAIACTSTMDYVWSLLSLIAMTESLVEDRVLISIISAAISFAIRGSSCILIFGMLAGAMTSEMYIQRKFSKRFFKIFGIGVAAMLLGCSPYIESYRVAGHTFLFLHPMGMHNPYSWTLRLKVARFFYKTLYLFGPLAWALLGYYTIFYWKHRKNVEVTDMKTLEYRKRALPMFWGAVFFSIVLFLNWPLEISYLIPGAFFFLLILGIYVLAYQRWMTFILFITIVSADIVTLQIATPNIINQATGFKIHPSIIRGQLIEDVEIRRSLLKCNSFDCWLQVRGDP